MNTFSYLIENTRGHEHEPRLLQAQRMVLDYARYIESYAPMPGRIVDAIALPHEKRAMKEALLLCIANSDDEHLREHLKAGYLMLSAYQGGVGDKVLGVDFSNLDLERDPQEVATEINFESAQASGWDLQVNADLRQLQRDLDALELECSPAASLSA